MNSNTKTVLIVILLVVVLPLVGIGASLFASIGTGTETSGPTVSETAVPTPTLTDPADVASASHVVLKTEKGDIHLELFPDKAPRTVKNFVTLGKRGYYDGVQFHRVLKDFVIQAGDPTATGSGGESIYGSTFPDEINDQKIVPGSLAMANRGPDTNSSQFFIVTEKDQPSLDGGYTNFGKVADDASMKVVRAIAAVPVNNPSEGRPVTPIKITGFNIEE